MSELSYRPSDSTAVWIPSIRNQPDVAYVYELSMENGSTIESSRVSNAELPLLGLESGKSYILNVWEECDNQWESVPSQLSFEGVNSSFEIQVRAAEPPQNPGTCTLDSFEGQFGLKPCLLVLFCRPFRATV